MVNLLENWLWKRKDYSITVEALLANQIYVLPSRHSLSFPLSLPSLAKDARYWFICPSPGNLRGTEEGNLTLAQGMRSKERSIKLVTSPLAKMILCFRVKLIKKTRRTLHVVGLFILEGLLLQGDERFSPCVFEFCPF